MNHPINLMVFVQKVQQYRIWIGLLFLFLTTCSQPLLANIPLATATATVTSVHFTSPPTAQTTARATPSPTIIEHQPTQRSNTITSSAPSPTISRPPSPTPTAHNTASFPSKQATPLASAEIESATCFANGEVIQTTFYSRLQKSERNVRIYLPPCYGSDQYRYPVLYMLHGSGQSDATWDVVLELDESAELLIQQRTIPPFVIVMPDGRPWSQTTSGGAESLEAFIINELIPFVEEGWCISNRRPHRAIGGVSRGGYWSTEIAFRHADRFGSVGAHSVAFLDSGDDPAINPLYTALTNNLRGLRIYFDFGRDDLYIDPARQLHEQMTANDIPHEWIVQAGGHNEAYWISQKDAYLTWYAAPWSFNRQAYGQCPHAGES